MSFVVKTLLSTPQGLPLYINLSADQYDSEQPEKDFKFSDFVKVFFFTLQVDLIDFLFNLIY